MSKVIAASTVLVCAFGLLACSGEPGPAGSNGTNGAPGPSGSNGANGANGAGQGDAGSATSRTDFTLSPPWALLERKDSPVVISAMAEGVDFTADPPTVDFGPEVSAGPVTVLNAHTLSTTLLVNKNAAVGFRNVTVRTRSALLKASMAFDVRAPISVDVLGGVPAQGGRVRLRITNHDLTPFDVNAVRLLIGAGVDFVDTSMGPLTSAGPGVLSFTALIDALAPAGPLQIGVGNFSLGGASPDNVFYSDREALMIAARPPKAVAPGSDVTGETVSKDMDTVSYKLSSAAGTILDVAVVGTGSGAKPCYWLTSRSGKARELLKYEGSGPLAGRPLTRTLLPFDASTGDVYLIVGDADGRSGPASSIGWTVSAVPVAATAVAETAVAHGAAAPQVIAAAANGALVVSGAIATSAEVDAYRIDLATPAALTLSITRRNVLGSVVISSSANFQANALVVPLSDAVWNARATTATTSSTWYVKVAGTTTDDLTSYVMALRPE